MGQALRFDTRRTLAATVIFLPVGAVEVLRIGQGQGKLPASGWTPKHLCVADAAFRNRLKQTRFHLLLSYDLFKSHVFLLGFKNTQISCHFALQKLHLTKKGCLKIDSLLKMILKIIFFGQIYNFLNP